MLSIHYFIYLFISSPGLTVLELSFKASARYQHHGLSGRLSASDVFFKSIFMTSLYAFSNFLIKIFFGFPCYELTFNFPEFMSNSTFLF